MFPSSAEDRSKAREYIELHDQVHVRPWGYYASCGLSIGIQSLTYAHTALLDPCSQVLAY